MVRFKIEPPSAKHRGYQVLGLVGTFRSNFLPDEMLQRASKLSIMASMPQWFQYTLRARNKGGLSSTCTCTCTCTCMLFIKTDTILRLGGKAPSLVLRNFQGLRCDVICINARYIHPMVSVITARQGVGQVSSIDILTDRQIRISAQLGTVCHRCAY